MGTKPQVRPRVRPCVGISTGGNQLMIHYSIASLLIRQKVWKVLFDVGHKANKASKGHQWKFSHMVGPKVEPEVKYPQ